MRSGRSPSGTRSFRSARSSGSPARPNLLALMPGQLGVSSGSATAAFGAKVITVFPGNDATPVDSHLGVVLLFEAEMGRLLAIIDASSVTAIRTAAVSGVATKLLAIPDAGDLAILGAGVQAMTHLEAMSGVRTIRRVRVWSRIGGAMRAVCVAQAQQKIRHRRGSDAQSAEEAVKDADLICTVTASREPVLEGEWISRRRAHQRRGRRVADRARARHRPRLRAARSTWIGASRRWPRPATSSSRRPKGRSTHDHIRGEIGEVLMGAGRSRIDRRDHAVQVVRPGDRGPGGRAAHLQKGVALGTGVWVSLGGLREP